MANARAIVNLKGSVAVVWRVMIQCDTRHQQTHILSGVATPGPIRAQALVNYPCALVKLLVPEYERTGIAWERG